MKHAVPHPRVLNNAVTRHMLSWNFELRLEQDQSPPGVRRCGQHAWQYVSQANEGDINHHDFGRSVKRRQGAGIGALKQADSGVSPQTRRKLTSPHIHRRYVRRACLQKAVGKPAGRRPNVQGNGPVHRKPKMLKGRRQLSSATADITDLVPAQFDLCIDVSAPPRPRFNPAGDYHKTVLDQLTG